MSEPSNYGREGRRGQRPGNEKDDTDLVDVVLRPYGEGTVYYVNWEVRPKDPAHAILRAQVTIEPNDLVPTDYNIIAQLVDPDRGPTAPPGLMLRGESVHRNVPPGTAIRVTIFGEVQISEAAQGWFTYSRTVVSGNDTPTPCEEAGGANST